jgi:hypothetical protein
MSYHGPFLLSFTLMGAYSLFSEAPKKGPSYTIAFKSLEPYNTDVFIAGQDGTNPRPLAIHPALDYNASFSSDGQWVVFTSHRAASADVYPVRLDGTGLERLTDHTAFDDQGALLAGWQVPCFRIESERTGRHLDFGPHFSQSAEPYESSRRGFFGLPGRVTANRSHSHPIGIRASCPPTADPGHS